MFDSVIESIEDTTSTCKLSSWPTEVPLPRFRKFQEVRWFDDGEWQYGTVIGEIFLSEKTAGTFHKPGWRYYVELKTSLNQAHPGLPALSSLPEDRLRLIWQYHQP